MQGPLIQVLIKENTIFQDGSADTSFSLDLKPIDLNLLNNSWMTPWTDGREQIEKGYITVLPENRLQEMSTREDRQWCYRLVVVAKTSLQVKVVVQVLPLDLATISSGLWADSTYLGGVVVHRSQASWFPTLPPACTHQGPAPYLIDRRDVTASDVLLTLQAYRDLVFDMLRGMKCPVAVALTGINVATPNTKLDPVVGNIIRVEEEEAPQGGSNSKRARVQPGQDVNNSGEYHNIN